MGASGILFLGNSEYEVDRIADLLGCLGNVIDKSEFVIQGRLQIPGYKNVKRLSTSEMVGLIKSVDIVMCHGGYGMLQQCFSCGVIPFCFPRRAAYCEHIDDHQTDLYEFFAHHGLILSFDYLLLGSSPLFCMISDLKADEDGVAKLLDSLLQL